MGETAVITPQPDAEAKDAEKMTEEKTESSKDVQAYQTYQTYVQTYQARGKK